MQKHRCHIEISPAALEHNLRRVREWVPEAKVMAVIKADGYGHGMEVVANALPSADEFGVSSIDDAKRLRDQGFDKPLTMLSPQFCLADIEWLVSENIRPVIFDYEQLGILRQFDSRQALDIWLKVDTGMGRLGFSVEDLPLVKARVDDMNGIGSVSLMSHLANADQPDSTANQRQFDAFDRLKSAAYRQHSILNSAGVASFSEHAADLVRPGLLMYGISPVHGVSAEQLGLRAVMEFKSSVISVRQMPSGSSIGYGGTYTLDSDSRIAIISCGYGDGYPRHAPNGTTVMVNGFLVPLVGRVSMDMITVDVGELPVQVGDPAVLWGSDNPIEEIAMEAGTIPYELTCGVTSRVARVMV